MKKLYIIIFFFAILALGLTSCVPSNVFSYHPVQYPNSTWAASNEKISFTIGEDPTKPIYGLLMVDNNEIEIELHMGINVSLIEVRATVADEEKTIEFWNSKTVKKDVFIITVVESTYFKKNQELVFERQKR